MMHSLLLLTSSIVCPHRFFRVSPLFKNYFLVFLTMVFYEFFDHNVFLISPRTLKINFSLFFHTSSFAFQFLQSGCLCLFSPVVSHCEPYFSKLSLAWSIRFAPTCTFLRASSICPLSNACCSTYSPVFSTNPAHLAALVSAQPNCLSCPAVLLLGPIWHYPSA